MTRDVLIRISGLQTLNGESSDVEVITSGDYFYKMVSTTWFMRK